MKVSGLPVEKQSLKSKTAEGMAWTTFNTFVVQGINVLFGIILARILMPYDYGLIGMLAIFLAISQQFVDGGFRTALIQKSNCSEDDYSTVFYFNLAIAAVLYVILFLAAPWIAKFYHTLELIKLTRILSLILIINALSIVQQARLYIKLNFKAYALVSLFSVIISASIGFFLAYRGWGVWALVIQSLSYALIKTLLIFCFDRWVPRLFFSLLSFKRLFGFSFRLLGAGLISTLATDVYSMLIGRKFTARDLGFYTTAQKYPDLLAGAIINILQSTTFPVLTSVQSDRERMISIYERLMGMTVFFVMPIMTLFALLAGSFVNIFLTDKWMPIVPLLQWLCFCRIITTVNFFNMNVVNVIGRSDLFLKVEIIKLFVMISGLAITIHFGLQAVVVGYFIVASICFFINAYYPGKLFGYGAIKQIKAMRCVICSTLIMSLGIFGLKAILQTDFMKLLICIPSSVIIYLFLTHLFKIKEAGEVFNIFQLMVLKKKTSISV